jgi:hypothetical protein
LLGSLALYFENLAAFYVAVGSNAVIWILYTIDRDLSNLLDHYGLAVTDAEIDRRAKMTRQPLSPGDKYSRRGRPERSAKEPAV